MTSTVFDYKSERGYSNAGQYNGPKHKKSKRNPRKDRKSCGNKVNPSVEPKFNLRSWFLSSTFSAKRKESGCKRRRSKKSSGKEKAKQGKFLGEQASSWADMKVLEYWAKIYKVQRESKAALGIQDKGCHEDCKGSWHDTECKKCAKAVVMEHKSLPRIAVEWVDHKSGWYHEEFPLINEQGPKVFWPKIVNMVYTRQDRRESSRNFDRATAMGKTDPGPTTTNQSVLENWKNWPKKKDVKRVIGKPHREQVELEFPNEYFSFGQVEEGRISKFKFFDPESSCHRVLRIWEHEEFIDKSQQPELSTIQHHLETNVPKNDCCKYNLWCHFNPDLMTTYSEPPSPSQEPCVNAFNDQSELIDALMNQLDSGFTFQLLIENRLDLLPDIHGSEEGLNAISTKIISRMSRFQNYLLNDQLLHSLLYEMDTNKYTSKIAYVPFSTMKKFDLIEGDNVRPRIIYDLRRDYVTFLVHVTKDLREKITALELNVYVIRSDFEVQQLRVSHVPQSYDICEWVYVYSKLVMKESFINNRPELYNRLLNVYKDNGFSSMVITRLLRFQSEKVSKFQNPLWECFIPKKRLFEKSCNERKVDAVIESLFNSPITDLDTIIAVVESAHDLDLQAFYEMLHPVSLKLSIYNSVKDFYYNQICLLSYTWNYFGDNAKLKSDISDMISSFDSPDNTSSFSLNDTDILYFPNLINSCTLGQRFIVVFKDEGHEDSVEVTYIQIRFLPNEDDKSKEEQAVKTRFKSELPKFLDDSHLDIEPPSYEELQDIDMEMDLDMKRHVFSNFYLERNMSLSKAAQLIQVEKSLDSAINGPWKPKFIDSNSRLDVVGPLMDSLDSYDLSIEDFLNSYANARGSLVVDSDDVEDLIAKWRRLVMKFASKFKMSVKKAAKLFAPILMSSGRVKKEDSLRLLEWGCETWEQMGLSKKQSYFIQEACRKAIGEDGTSQDIIEAMFDSIEVPINDFEPDHYANLFNYTSRFFGGPLLYASQLELFKEERLKLFNTLSRFDDLEMEFDDSETGEETDLDETDEGSESEAETTGSDLHDDLGPDQLGENNLSDEDKETGQPFEHGQSEEDHPLRHSSTFKRRAEVEEFGFDMESIRNELFESSLSDISDQGEEWSPEYEVILKTLVVKLWHSLDHGFSPSDFKYRLTVALKSITDMDDMGFETRDISLIISSIPDEELYQEDEAEDETDGEKEEALESMNRLELEAKPVYTPQIPFRLGEPSGERNIPGSKIEPSSWSTTEQEVETKSPSRVLSCSTTRDQIMAKYFKDVARSQAPVVPDRANKIRDPIDFKTALMIYRPELLLDPVFAGSKTSRSRHDESDSGSHCLSGYFKLYPDHIKYNKRALEITKHKSNPTAGGHTVRILDSGPRSSKCMSKFFNRPVGPAFDRQAYLESLKILPFYVKVKSGPGDAAGHISRDYFQGSTSIRNYMQSYLLIGQEFFSESDSEDEAELDSDEFDQLVNSVVNLKLTVERPTIETAENDREVPTNSLSLAEKSTIDYFLRSNLDEISDWHNAFDKERHDIDLAFHLVYFYEPFSGRDLNSMCLIQLRSNSETIDWKAVLGGHYKESVDEILYVPDTNAFLNHSFCSETFKVTFLICETVLKELRRLKEAKIGTPVKNFIKFIKRNHFLYIDYGDIGDDSIISIMKSLPASFLVSDDRDLSKKVPNCLSNYHFIKDTNKLDYNVIKDLHNPDISLYFNLSTLEYSEKRRSGVGYIHDRNNMVHNFFECYNLSRNIPDLDLLPERDTDPDIKSLRWIGRSTDEEKKKEKYKSLIRDCHRMERGYLKSYFSELANLDPPVETVEDNKALVGSLNLLKMSIESTEKQLKENTLADPRLATVVVKNKRDSWFDVELAKISDSSDNFLSEFLDDSGSHFCTPDVETKDKDSGKSRHNYVTIHGISMNFKSKDNKFHIADSIQDLNPRTDFCPETDDFYLEKMSHEMESISSRQGLIQLKGNKFLKNLSYLHQHMVFHMTHKFKSRKGQCIVNTNGFRNMGYILKEGRNSKISNIKRSVRYFFIVGSDFEEAKSGFKVDKVYYKPGLKLLVTKHYSVDIETVIYRSRLYFNTFMIRQKASPGDYLKFYFLLFFNHKPMQTYLSFFKYFNVVSHSNFNRLSGLIKKYFKRAPSSQAEVWLIKRIESVLVKVYFEKELETIFGRADSLEEYFEYNNLYTFPHDSQTSNVHNYAAFYRDIKENIDTKEDFCIPEVYSKEVSDLKHINPVLFSLGLKKIHEKYLQDYKWENIFVRQLEQNFSSYFETNTNCVDPLSYRKRKNKTVHEKAMIQYLTERGNIYSEDSAVDVMDYIAWGMSKIKEDRKCFSYVSIKKQKDAADREIYVQDYFTKLCHYPVVIFYRMLCDKIPVELVSKSEFQKLNELSKTEFKSGSYYVNGDMQKWSPQDIREKFELTTEMLFQSLKVPEPIQNLIEKSLYLTSDLLLVFDSRCGDRTNLYQNISDLISGSSLNEKVPHDKVKLMPISERSKQVIGVKMTHGWPQGIYHFASTFVHCMYGEIKSELNKMVSSELNTVYFSHSDDSNESVSKNTPFTNYQIKQLLNLSLRLPLSFSLAVSKTKVSVTTTGSELYKGLRISEMVSIYNVEGVLYNSYMRQAATVTKSFLFDNFVDNHLALISRCITLFSLSNKVIAPEIFYEYFFKYLQQQHSYDEDLKWNTINWGGKKSVSIKTIAKFGLCADNLNKYFEDPTKTMFQVNNVLSTKKLNNDSKSAEQYMLNNSATLIGLPPKSRRLHLRKLKELTKPQSGAFLDQRGYDLWNIYSHKNKEVYYLWHNKEAGLKSLSEVSTLLGSDSNSDMTEFLVPSKEYANEVILEIHSDMQWASVEPSSNPFHGGFVRNSVQASRYFTSEHDDMMTVTTERYSALLDLSIFPRWNEIVSDLKSFVTSFNIKTVDELEDSRESYEKLKKLAMLKSNVFYLYKSSEDFSDVSMRPNKRAARPRLDLVRNVDFKSVQVRSKVVTRRKLASFEDIIQARLNKCTFDLVQGKEVDLKASMVDCFRNFTSDDFKRLELISNSLVVKALASYFSRNPEPLHFTGMQLVASDNSRDLQIYSRVENGKEKYRFFIEGEFIIINPILNDGKTRHLLKSRFNMEVKVDEARYHTIINNEFSSSRFVSGHVKDLNLIRSHSGQIQLELKTRSGEENATNVVPVIVKEVISKVSGFRLFDHFVRVERFKDYTRIVRPTYVNLDLNFDIDREDLKVLPPDVIQSLNLVWERTKGVVSPCTYHVGEICKGAGSKSYWCRLRGRYQGIETLVASDIDWKKFRHGTKHLRTLVTAKPKSDLEGTAKLVKLINTIVGHNGIGLMNADAVLSRLEGRLTWREYRILYNATFETSPFSLTITGHSAVLTHKTTGLQISQDIGEDVVCEKKVCLVPSELVPQLKAFITRTDLVEPMGLHEVFEPLMELFDLNLDPLTSVEKASAKLSNMTLNELHSLVKFLILQTTVYRKPIRKGARNKIDALFSILPGMEKKNVLIGLKMSHKYIPGVLPTDKKSLQYVLSVFKSRHKIVAEGCHALLIARIMNYVCVSKRPLTFSKDFSVMYCKIPSREDSDPNMPYMKEIPRSVREEFDEAEDFIIRYSEGIAGESFLDRFIRMFDEQELGADVILELKLQVENMNLEYSDIDQAETQENSEDREAADRTVLKQVLDLVKPLRSLTELQSYHSEETGLSDQEIASNFLSFIQDVIYSLTCPESTKESLNDLLINQNMPVLTSMKIDIKGNSLFTTGFRSGDSLILNQINNVSDCSFRHGLKNHRDLLVSMLDAALRTDEESREPELRRDINTMMILASTMGLVKQLSEVRKRDPVMDLIKSFSRKDTGFLNSYCSSLSFISQITLNSI